MMQKNMGIRLIMEIMIHRVTLIEKMKFVFVFASFLLFAIVYESVAAQPLTRSYLQGLLSNPPLPQEKLRPGTRHGCVHIPARGFMQRLMVGFEVTGESCSVTVSEDNAVAVSFLDEASIHLVSTSTEDRRTDIFIGELENGQVLIVQHYRGEVASLTQTVYDENGDVVYGRFGNGDYIRECHFGMTTSERLAGRKKCKR